MITGELDEKPGSNFKVIISGEKKSGVVKMEETMVVNDAGMAHAAQSETAEQNQKEPDHDSTLKEHRQKPVQRVPLNQNVPEDSVKLIVPALEELHADALEKLKLTDTEVVDIEVADLDTVESEAGGPGKVDPLFAHPSNENRKMSQPKAKQALIPPPRHPFAKSGPTSNKTSDLGSSETAKKAYSFVEKLYTVLKVSSIHYNRIPFSKTVKRVT